MDQLKIINFIKHWPLVTCVISILSDEIWIRNKVLLCTKVWQLSQGKALVWLLGLWAQLRLFFSFHRTFLLKRTTDRQIMVIWQTFSQKWVKSVYLYKTCNWQYLLPMMKFKLSTENENFGKHIPTKMSFMALE